VTLKVFVSALVVCALVPSVAMSVATIEPPDASLGITRPLGPLGSQGSWGTEEEVWFLQPQSPTIRLRALLGDRDGERMPVTVSASPDQVDGGFLRGRLRAETVPAPGRYQGAIISGGTEWGRVTVEVQDAFWWPLIALLLGTGLGIGATKNFSTWRRRRLLIAAMREALEAYWRARELVPSFADLSLGLPKIGQLPSRRDCGPEESITDPIEQFSELWCAVLQASDDKTLEALAEKASVARSRIDALIELAAELDRLSQLLDRLADEDAQEIIGDSIDVANAAIAADEDERPLGRQRLLRQINLVSAYVAVTIAWNRLSGKQWNEHAELEPQKIYRELRPKTQSSSEAEAVLSALGAAKDQLLEIEVRREPGADESTLSLSAFPSALDALSALAIALAGPLPRPALEAKSARQLFASVRRWDVVFALAAGLFTGITYLVTGYSDHTFGTATDYLTAATAGLAGQIGGYALSPRAHA
jgi:hypothetical protein